MESVMKRLQSANEAKDEKHYLDLYFATKKLTRALRDAARDGNPVLMEDLDAFLDKKGYIADVGARSALFFEVLGAQQIFFEFEKELTAEEYYREMKLLYKEGEWLEFLNPTLTEEQIEKTRAILVNATKGMAKDGKSVNVVVGA